MIEPLAPILLFVYNRPDHTMQTIKALQNNIGASDSILYVYADGARENASENELSNIDAVRSVVNSIQGFKEVKTVFRNKNWGLAENVIDGVSEVIKKHGCVIVLEDDILSSPHFLRYCNENLSLYKEDKNVYAINAYQFPLNIQEFDTFLSPLGTSSWGWATWDDRWAKFSRVPNRKEYILSSPSIKESFNFGGYDYANMLSNKNSWAIHWYATVWSLDGLGIFPTQSLVQNIGFDGSGENCDVDSAYTVELLKSLPEKFKYQSKVHPTFVSKQKGYLMQLMQPPSLIAKIKGWINSNL